MDLRILLADNETLLSDAFKLVEQMSQEAGYRQRPNKTGFVTFMLKELESVQIFIAYAEQMPVGVVILNRVVSPYMHSYFGLMKTLYVLPEFRQSVKNANVAKALVDRLMREAVTRRYQGLQWFVYKSNSASLRFFEKQGIERSEDEEFVEFWLPADKMAA